MDKNTILINKENINEENLKCAGEIIKSGGLVAFPTETVYGLGGDGLNPKAIEKIFVAKGRPQDNPLILHICSEDMLKRLIVDDLERAKPIMEAFWPGPITLIFNKSPIVPYEATGGLETVAIRMPNDPIALKLIEYSDTAIAGPSANISGRPSPTDAATVLEDLDGRIDMILDGGNTHVGLESTVLDLTSETPQILRPGGVTIEDLKAYISNVVYDKSIVDTTKTPKSPGQKYTHYAPSKPCFLAVGTIEEKLKAIGDISKDKAVGYMISNELKSQISTKSGDVIMTYGSIKDYNTIGENIFRILRNLDKENIDIIVIEGVDYNGLGIAIMNRLEKSSGGNIIGKES